MLTLVDPCSFMPPAGSVTTTAPHLVGFMADEFAIIRSNQFPHLVLIHVTYCNQCGYSMNGRDVHKIWVNSGESGVLTCSRCRSQGAAERSAKSTLKHVETGHGHHCCHHDFITQFVEITFRPGDQITEISTAFMPAGPATEPQPMSWHN